MENKQTALLGIGSIQERNINKTIFELGQPDRRTGYISQVDTGDIAWSLLILRFGLIGILVYIFMYFKILVVLIKNRVNQLALIFASYMLLNFFFLSFGNTIIVHSEFFIFPLLITSQILNQKNEDNTSDIRS